MNPDSRYAIMHIIIAKKKFRKGLLNFRLATLLVSVVVEYSHYTFLIGKKLMSI